MEKPEVKIDPLTALYFPYTYIREGLLKSILFFFDSLVLYQPSEWQPSTVYPDLVKANRLRLEVPIQAGPDLPLLKQKVRHLLSWGDFVFSSGQLSYLKHLPEPAASLEGYDEIMAALRGETPAPVFDDTARTQLFLHLAQERDQREDETSGLSHKIFAQERQLWSELLLDGESQPQTSFAPVTEPEDEISIQARLKAWSRLFEKGFDGAEIPLTDRPEVLELLPPRESLLEITLPDLGDRPFSETLEFGLQNGAAEAVAKIKTYIKTTAAKLAKAKGTADIVKDTQSAELRDALQTLGKISRLDNLTPYFLSLYVFPGTSTTAIFTGGNSSKENGFAFLLTKGSLHGTA